MIYLRNKDQQDSIFFLNLFQYSTLYIFRTEVEGKAVPLQVWSDPEGSKKLRFPDFMTTAHDGGRIVSLTHRPSLPPGP